MNDYNIIEITANQLSDSAIRNAISTAGTTQQNDLIVCRTTTSQNTIILTGGELAININASQYGGVTIVSLGDAPLTIDAAGQSRVFNLSPLSNVSRVDLGGLTITGGYTPGNGGGISGGNVIVVNCTISNNTAYSGGGINSGLLTVIDSTISNNTASSGGGGISSTYINGVGIDARFSLIRCTISGNQGGGVTISVQPDLAKSPNSNGQLIENCVISDNQGVGISYVITSSYFLYELSGYGFDITQMGKLRLTNVTIVGNTGGGISNKARMEVVNSIIAHNATNVWTEVNYYISPYYGRYAYTDITYSLIDDATNSTTGLSTYSPTNRIGNIVGTSTNPIDPRFVFYSDATHWSSWDLRLQPTSPAINAGNPNYISDPLAIDIDGNPRISGDRIDMGAYEFQSLL